MILFGKADLSFHALLHDFPNLTKIYVNHMRIIRSGTADPPTSSAGDRFDVADVFPHLAGSGKLMEKTELEHSMHKVEIKS